jgi:hypothetical protein
MTEPLISAKIVAEILDVSRGWCNVLLHKLEKEKKISFYRFETIKGMPPSIWISEEDLEIVKTYHDSIKNHKKKYTKIDIKKINNMEAERKKLLCKYCKDFGSCTEPNCNLSFNSNKSKWKLDKEKLV